MYFFNKLKDYLETNNIHILYYLNEQYINQVSEFIISKNIHIFPINIKKGIDLWIENKNLPFTILTRALPRATTRQKKIN